jgi:glyoxylase-like metal-dependent hydrolase (beta-lactamase superfamily II)
VLVVGDYVSPVEIPWISASGSASAYLATLARMEPLIERAEHVVPGHGTVLDSERALAILREDRAYLEALVERGAEASLPLARRNGVMRKIHAENAGRVGSRPSGGGS